MMKKLRLVLLLLSFMILIQGCDKQKGNLLSINETYLNKAYDEQTIFKQLFISFNNEGVSEDILLTPDMLDEQSREAIKTPGLKAIKITYNNYTIEVDILIKSINLDYLIKEHYETAASYYQTELPYIDFSAELEQYLSNQSLILLDVSVSNDGYLQLHTSDGKTHPYILINQFSSEGLLKYISVSSAKTTVKNADYTPDFINKLGISQSTSTPLQYTRSRLNIWHDDNITRRTKSENGNEYGYKDVITEVSESNTPFLKYYVPYMENYGKEIKNHVDTTLQYIHILDQWVGISENAFSKKVKLTYDSQNKMYNIEFFIPNVVTENSGTIYNDGTHVLFRGVVRGSYLKVRVWYDENGIENITARQMDNLIWDETSSYFDDPRAQFSREDKPIKYMNFIDGQAYEFYERTIKGYKTYVKMEKDANQVKFYTINGGDMLNYTNGSLIQSVENLFVQTAASNQGESLNIYDDTYLSVLHISKNTWNPKYNALIPISHLTGWQSMMANHLTENKIGLLTDNGLFETPYYSSPSEIPYEFIQDVKMILSTGGGRNVDGEYSHIFANPTISFEINVVNINEAFIKMFAALDVLGLSFITSNDQIDRVTTEARQSVQATLENIVIHDIENPLTHRTIQFMNYMQSLVDITYEELLVVHDIVPELMVPTNDEGEYIEKIGIDLKVEGQPLFVESSMDLSNIIVSTQPNEYINNEFQYELVLGFKYNHMIIDIEYFPLLPNDGQLTVDAMGLIDIEKLITMYPNGLKNIEMVLYIVQNIEGEKHRLSDFSILTFDNGTIEISINDVVYKFNFESNTVTIE